MNHTTTRGSQTPIKLAWAEKVLRQAEHKVGMRQVTPLKAHAFEHDHGCDTDPFTQLGIGLNPGATIGVWGSTGLLLAMVGRAMKHRDWVAFVGFSSLSAAAVREYGVDLTRTVFIPLPGEQVLRTLATVIDGFNVVVVGPEVMMSPARRRSLLGRARSQATVLFVPPWPQVPTKVEAKPIAWRGLGQGEGYLRERHLSADISSPRGQSQVKLRLSSGAVEVVQHVKRGGGYAIASPSAG